MDEDTAYVEAVGSARALSSLQFMGLPIPQDRLGGVLRYQTDHDEVGRATSCGPRTSRLMVQALAREAIRLDVPIFNHTTGVRLLVDAGRAASIGRRHRGRGRRHRTVDNPLGFAVVFCATCVVIATGGPGELYRDSVYPRHCFGSLGLALEAGHRGGQSHRKPVRHRHVRATTFPGTSPAPMCSACPMSSRATRGGTSATSSPTITGRRRSSRPTSSARAISGRSMRPACSTSARACSTLPCFARRRRDGRCSWISTATRSPCRATRSSISTGWTPTSQAYLRRAGALLTKPLDRLRKMNPLSIELYKRYKYDITCEPLEFAINNQHMNGGLAVDTGARRTSTAATRSAKRRARMA